MALRSKGHWGYSADFLEMCRPELTFTPETCGSGRMWVVEANGDLVGFTLIGGDPPVGELAALFVDPAAIGTGCGALLLRHAIREATELGFSHLELEADPQAAAFYLHHGARSLGTVPSGSVAGRELPHLVFVLRS